MPITRQNFGIDPRAILRANGIRVTFNDYGEAFDGLLEHRSGRFHVFCNTARVGKDTPRTRFTLAHELGHYFIDEHRRALEAGRVRPHGSICDFESPVEVELEADCFAASLLLPTSAVAPAVRGKARGLGGVVSLVAKFNTSITATAMRYLDVDPHPCVVIRWGLDGYAWKRLSESAYRAGLRKTVQDTAALPRGCATAKVMAGSAKLESNGTTKAAWFPFVGDDWDSNALFMEEAISLGKYGALTMLYPLDR